MFTGRDGKLLVDAGFSISRPRIEKALSSLSSDSVKYLINTHYHGDHTGGNAAFHKDGATIVAQDNIRVRLAAGTTNALTGNKAAPALWLMSAAVLSGVGALTSRRIRPS